MKEQIEKLQGECETLYNFSNRCEYAQYKEGNGEGIAYEKGKIHVLTFISERLTTILKENNNE